MGDQTLVSHILDERHYYYTTRAAVNVCYDILFSGKSVSLLFLNKQMVYKSEIGQQI